MQGSLTSSAISMGPGILETLSDAQSFYSTWVIGSPTQVAYKDKDIS